MITFSLISEILDGYINTVVSPSGYNVQILKSDHANTRLYSVWYIP